jgi:trk system potassium uptake protein TrkH
MILRPTFDDWKTVGFYTGKIIIGVGLLMLVPLTVALFSKEWAPATDFLIGFFTCLLAGFLLELICYTKNEPTWFLGLVTASLSWIIAMTLGAIPHYLSGHFGSFLDACFDLMSGYTTTGLYLLQDLDHVSNALNMWRHLLTYAGGQGIIVVALTFLFRGTTGGWRLYVGEGKDEKLIPNLADTARAIWAISLSYLVIGSFFLWITGMQLGIAPVRSFLHSIWIFMGAWSTGGFAPQSYNVGYYHSSIYEIITIVIMILGSFNFALHWAVWTGKRREIYKNIEVIVFTASVLIATLLASSALIRSNLYPDSVVIFRKIFYHIASGQTTTGFSTIASRQFVRDWGPLGMIAASLAMAIGASASSTGGGFKGLRVGILTKALLQDIKKLILPESAVVVTKFHHIRDNILTNEHVRSAGIIVLSYIFIYSFGTVLGMILGYPLSDSLFESISAGSNTGLSAGVTSPFMPVILKITYILEMWLGRLEFMSIFALFGFVYASTKGK